MLTRNVSDHQAVKAWLDIRPDCVEPRWIELLKDRKERTTYRLAGAGPGRTAIIAKRARTAKAIQERFVYEEVLPHLSVPTLRFYGFVEEHDKEFCWLFLEDAGPRRYSPLVAAHRTIAARWFGQMHAAASLLSPRAKMPDRGPSLYLTYLRSAQEQIPRLEALSSLSAHGRTLLMRIVSLCNFLDSHWSQIDSFCQHMPRTFVHGDCLAKNVHIRGSRQGLSLAPFDWAGAGWGLPATDLGQLRLPYDGKPPPPTDFVSYHTAIKEQWPSLDMPTIQRLANLGQMFWALKVISLSLPSFVHAQAELEHVVYKYRIYAAVLEDSVRSAELAS